jgi:hypothetical protein
VQSQNEAENGTGVSEFSSYSNRKPGHQVKISGLEFLATFRFGITRNLGCLDWTYMHLMGSKELKNPVHYSVLLLPLVQLISEN